MGSKKAYTKRVAKNEILFRRMNSREKKGRKEK
jgi:hypothetical protein